MSVTISDKDFRSGRPFKMNGRTYRGLVIKDGERETYGLSKVHKKPPNQHVTFNLKGDRLPASVPAREWTGREEITFDDKLFIEIKHGDDYWYTGYTLAPKTSFGKFCWNFAHGKMMGYPLKDVFLYSLCSMKKDKKGWGYRGW